MCIRLHFFLGLKLMNPSRFLLLEPLDAQSLVYNPVDNLISIVKDVYSGESVYLSYPFNDNLVTIQ